MNRSAEPQLHQRPYLCGCSLGKGRTQFGYGQTRIESRTTLPEHHHAKCRTAQTSSTNVVKVFPARFTRPACVERWLRFPVMLEG